MFWGLFHSKYVTISPILSAVFFLIFPIGARPFPCPHCDKIFRTSGHRKTHIASHFKSLQQKKHRFPRKTNKAKLSKSNLPLPDIPLQEPILITDFGKSASKQACVCTHGMGLHLYFLTVNMHRSFLVGVECIVQWLSYWCSSHALCFCFCFCFKWDVFSHWRLYVPVQASCHPRTLAWLSNSTWRWWAMIGLISASSVVRPIKNPVI